MRIDPEERQNGEDSEIMAKRRYDKPEHFVTFEQAIRLFEEAELFEASGKIARTAELRMFAKGIYGQDDVNALSMTSKLIYRRLAQRLISMNDSERKNAE